MSHRFGGFLKKDTTEVIKMGPFIDPADDTTEELALSLVVELAKAGGAFAARNSGTAITHDAEGWYYVELNATDINTNGRLVAKAQDGANHKPVSVTFYVLPVHLYDCFNVLLNTINSNMRVLDGSQINRTKLVYLAKTVIAYLVDDSTFTPTSTQFEIKLAASNDTLPANDDQIIGEELRFSNGADRNIGIGFRITDYDVINNRITISPAAFDTILNNDTVIIQRRASVTSSEVGTSINNSIENYNLDHLLKVAITGGDVTNNSALAKLASKAPTSNWSTFDNQTDSLEAISDFQAPNIQWAPFIPHSVGLNDTANLGIEVSDATGDLPTIAEITPGTIRIRRRAVDTVGWVETLATTPVNNILDGIMYYPESFSPGRGYFEGDTVEVTLAGQKVTVNSVDYEMTSANGNKYYFEVRHSIPQKFKDLYENAFFIRVSVDTVTNNGDFTIQAESGYTLSASNDTYNGVWLTFTENNNDGVSKFISVYTGATKRVQFLSSDGNRDAPFPNTVQSGDKGFIIGHR